MPVSVKGQFMLARSLAAATLACTIRLWALCVLALGLYGLEAPTTKLATAQEPAKKPAAQAMPPLDQVQVDRVVQLGVEFLRRNQHPQGHWGTGTGPGSDKGWAVGYTCLAGLALVECGIPTSDPGIKAAASGIRHYAKELDSTYEVALAILFLDRMGDRSDRRIIQTLAARLIAGQSATGGWGYKVPKYTTAESTSLLAAIRRFSPPAPPPPPSVRERPLTMGLCIKMSDDTFFRPPPKFDAVQSRKQAVSTLPTKMKRLPVLAESVSDKAEDPKEKRHDPTTGTTDNSNTHFAILGLWAARKHDVPTDRSFGLLTERFRASQGKDGSWAYDFVRGGANGPPQMTCIALLGLAIGHVVNPDPSNRPEKDPRVVNAFAALTARIGQPAGSFENRPSIKDAGGLYFLWAMERIAVLYDVSRLDKKDWYRWGAEILIGHQAADGSWTEEGGYPGQHPVLNTALAVLFLKRANLTPDLSRRLTVDTVALTAKVDDKVAPKPAPTPPRKEPEPTPVVVEPPRKEPPPSPPPTRPTVPAVTTPVVESPPPTTASAKSRSSGTIWVVLLVLLALSGAGLVVFGIRRSRAAAEDRKKPRKGKKRAMKPARAAEEDGEGE